MQQGFCATQNTIFLSTPSARRATFMAWVKDFYKLISIHALREEGDASCSSTAVPDLTISIHALREEGDPSCPASRR